MAVRFGGWNEGSLLRRTLIHVGAFVLGSSVFVAIASIVLVAAARSALPSRDGAKADASASASPSAASTARKPSVGKLGKRSSATARDRDESSETAGADDAE